MVQVRSKMAAGFEVQVRSKMAEGLEIAVQSEVEEGHLMEVLEQSELEKVGIDFDAPQLPP